MSRELFGAERDRVIREHLEWMAVREIRECIEIDEGYPLAAFARRHRAELAKRRTEAMGYYRNTKPGSRGRR